MPLLIPLDSGGLDPRVASALDEIIAPLQVWAGAVDGVNAAERLNELTAGIASLPTVQTGMGALWFTSTPPTGYLICDGSEISRSTYANLFNLPGWGTTFGAGNGSTTFNLPNLKQRFPLGKAASGTGATLGSTGGTIDHAHTLSGSTATESAHTHGAGSLVTATHDHTGVTGATQVYVDHMILIKDSFTDDGTNQKNAVTDESEDPHTHTISTQAALAVTGTSGAGSSHSHGAGTLAGASANPPYFVVNFIVKT